jgi:hypothetical protein
MATKLWHLPLRLATGAFILDQGLAKLGMDDEHAKQLQSRGSLVYPRLAELDPRDFALLLAASEIGLGAALLGIGLVPPGLAGLGLTGFSGSLTRLYLKAPGTRQEGGLRPTREGMGLAKDAWMLAIGSALVLDAVFGPRRRRRRGSSPRPAQRRARAGRTSTRREARKIRRRPLRRLVTS